MKIKNYIVTVSFLVFFLGGALLCLLHTPQEYSASERRKLKQFPKITWETVLNTKAMSEFESYTLDQFPFRDAFRTVKAITHYYVFGQKDNNDVYLAGDSVSKLEYPLRPNLITSAGKKFETLYNSHFKDTGANVYAAVIPDKNYFLAAQNGYPSIDYKELLKLFRESTPDFKHIDLFDTLTIDQYYRTDTHWRQECLSGVVDVLAEGMNIADRLNWDYVENTAEIPFYGVYYGQAALPMAPDTLTYLTNPILDGCTVYNYETGKTTGIYDMEKLTSDDPYEVFLSGAAALLTIENPACTDGRELVVFRDSFGSSIVPLLAGAYSKITLVDIRYVDSNYLPNLVDLSTADDVLFLYSAMVLNQSNMLK